MSDPLIERVRPVDDPLSNFFWTSGSDGRLRFMRCADCSYYSQPATSHCPRCLSAAMSPQAVQGTGVVYTFTVNHQQWVKDQPPYVIAVIQLDEQDDLRLTSNVVDCEVSDVHIGMRVVVTFHHRNDVWYPLFAPAGSNS
jgi:uncharacterized OB-fold protein